MIINKVVKNSEMGRKGLGEIRGVCHFWLERGRDHHPLLFVSQSSDCTDGGNHKHCYMASWLEFILSYHIQDISWNGNASKRISCPTNQMREWQLTHDQSFLEGGARNLLGVRVSGLCSD